MHSLQLPAGFSYYNSATKEHQNPTQDHRSAEWQRASSAFEKKKNPVIMGQMLRALTPERGSLDHYHSASDLVRSKSDRRRQSDRGLFLRGPWKQEIPDPLPNWTLEDQQVLIDVMNDFPRAGRDDTQLEVALIHSRRKLPHKTIEECHLCFKHIQGSRVAVFT